MNERRIYIEPMPLGDAQRLWREKLEALGAWSTLGAETLAVDGALGRVTAGPVFARVSSPFYHSAAMDGVAVRFEDTLGASERGPKRLAVGRDAVYVDTGDPLPDGFNSVIMVEDIDELESREIEIIAPATPWQHVRVIGEDIVATELILPENQRIRPQDISAMLAGGITEIMARRRPVVALIPTGNELVEPGALLKKGDIIEYNSRMLAGMVREWGGEPLRYGIVPDSLEALKKYVMDASGKADLVVVNAGSSAGSEDFTYHVVKELGEVYVHGINTKPGKPAILGAVGGKPVMGAPGYPVSAWLVFGLFAKGLVYRMQGLVPPPVEKVEARLSRQLASQLGPEEFVRVKLGRVDDNVVATPLPRGAGVLMSLVKADGIIRIPPGAEGLAAGGSVEAELLGPRDALDNTVVCIGSHDNALDLLASFLKRRRPELSLSSAHVGSMGGLVALARGEAHMAGCHLLDERTGEYNVSYVQKHLAGTKSVLVNLVYRVQGFIVPRDNPKSIAGFSDLARPEVSFVNRQAGAGTRLLTDLHLKRAGIDVSKVRGYDHEEYTHMGVASAVLTGVADTGLGILAAANALGLGFVPVSEERYDLVIPERHYDTDKVQAVVELIREDAGFREAVNSMGGYDTRDMGREMWRG
jgi:molybdopterin molybdotransferase/putative molybdopterin biosynthesis protein